MSTKTKLERVQEKLRRELEGCHDCLHLLAEDSLENFDSLYEVVSDIVTVAEFDKLLVNVRCPREDCTFNTVHDYVLRRSKGEIEAEEKVKKSKKFEPSLNAFREHLSKFPYLGLVEPKGIGRKIIKGLGKKKGITIKDEVWYRARLLKSDGVLFEQDGMWDPNAEIHEVGEGRYNHTGMSFLYLAENPETALREVRSNSENSCAMQKFKLNNIENVLDLRDQVYNDPNVNPEDDLYAVALIHSGQLTRETNKGSSWKPEYLVPRFVADTARHLKFKGIIFTSVYGYDNSNLILFEYSRQEVLFEGDPYLFNYKEPDGLDMPGSDDSRFKILDEPL